jgi:transglutaminase-like putative cysteine protease
VNAAPPLGRDLAATIALTSYSLVVAAGFARVFSGWGFMSDLAALVILGHSVSFALRRLRVSGWFAIPFLSLFLVWLLAVQAYSDTMTWLIPRGATWDQVTLEIDLVRDQFQTAVAPVLYGAGWATLAGFAIIVTVVMADSFAFRADARGEALVPGGVLFVFIAALASDRLRIVLTALLVAAGIVTVIALRTLHDRRRRVELRSSRTATSLAVPAALATAVAVAVLAGVVGPRIPGAQAEPLYETRGRGGGVTNIISPLVDIRSRLTSRGDVELFRVNADAPAYWRVTTLPAFDGQRFSLPQRPLERIDGGGTAVGDAPEIRQQIQVLSLGGVLIPAAADPVGAEGFSDGERLDLRLNRDTSSLLAPDDLAPGDLFRIVSAQPRLTPDVLRAATSVAPPDAIFTELPDELPDIVDELAREVTAGTTNSYDAAMALQNWFRDPNEFSYSLEVQSGHGTNAIESFFNERVGYCEQFAATFATMARSLGIPSRVAVGFTPGVLADDGWYSVIGKNAHAWPELWFDGIGWVPFEPTPGRGAPGAESYTGVAPAQDESGPDGSGAASGPTESTLPPAPTTVVPPQTTVPAGGATATTVPGGPNIPSDGGLTDFDGDDAFPAASSNGGPPRTVLLAGLAVLAVAAPAVARRIRKRRERAGDLDRRVRAAWDRAIRAAIQAGVTGRASMTVHEWASATASELPVAARPMSALADVVDQVTFAPPDAVDLERHGAYGTTLGHDCELWADQIARIATDTLSGPQRVRRYFTTWS